MQSFNPWVNVERVRRAGCLLSVLSLNVSAELAASQHTSPFSQHAGRLRRQPEEVVDPGSRVFHLRLAAPGHQGGQPAGGDLPS